MAQVVELYRCEAMSSNLSTASSPPPKYYVFEKTMKSSSISTKTII
jgi:hypothetical protein